MTVRHLTTVGNVDADGYLVDATQVCHGTLAASRVAALGGPIDPSTHLNRDFPDHQLGECVIAEAFEVGAPVVLDTEGQFTHARPRHDASTALGPVNLGERRAEWLAAICAHRDERVGT